jgi:ATP-binding cassette subfamily B (MDR/TAP) protein 1
LADQSPKEEPSSNFVIPQIAEMDPALPLVDIQGVSFAYPARSTRQVLKDFSMKVFPGQSVAIVGPSGSGKSTVIQLLERFYDADFGQIAIGGIPIQDYPSDKLRQIFALVSQEPVLYQGTIAENINLGCSKPLDEQQLSQVLVQSQLTDVISSLPEGTHTVVGSRGGQLSGGQKQRVAIARAVAMGSPILLLDEATSALDSESERLIQTALSKTSQGKTAIAVAHRLSTIQHFDRILVLQEGSVVESGSHGELLAKKGRYWAMVDQQAGLPKSKP